MLLIDALSKKKKETVKHIFMDYKFSMGVWPNCLCSIIEVVDFSGSVIECICGFKTLILSRQGKFY